ncbi:hypothetical protein FEM48_Zijuj07G0137700 [Ziziphus jujuba var. spinosa]|uniref:Endonuclease/exonuclease/phosphatase domain-containing protein n=1 Tax=Ziziphus jujuba var. spinosa TaxID=714518 RepID=A0A978V4Z8_ZIZJJ|nr:hypothetical protein FEM48_Zijuj07G0137700 [Ziziphus jujuba var. spinosa]
MQSDKVQVYLCNNQASYMLSFVRRKLKHFCSRIRRLLRRRKRPKIIIKRFGKLNSEVQRKGEPGNGRNGQLGYALSEKPIRIATFNVAMFTLAPAISKAEQSSAFNHENGDYLLKSPAISDRPKSILKQSPLRTTLTGPPEYLSKTKNHSRSNLKVSINLPDNEISLAHSKLLAFVEDEKQSSSNMITSRVPVRSPVCFPSTMRSPVCFPSMMTNYWTWSDESLKTSRSILEVLREVDADILALQDVKAKEEREMKPLSDLASALGMKYVFAESWAPENVLKATIDVPWAGEVNFYCTQLDHLDENWRMKQISALFQANDPPHILAGGLNSLNGGDYSAERWADIVKYYEDMGKPTPKTEVMKFLKGKGYVDAKDYAGDYVQGTCKYGTRVDYVLSLPDSPYKFVPGSYTVVSSKGTSDHHMVKVDIVKESKIAKQNVIKRQQKSIQKLVRRTTTCSSRTVWRVNS